MKKMIIVAAIVCAATISQAASIAWGIAAVQATPAEKAPAAGWMTYFMDGSTYETFSGLAVDKIGAYIVANATYSAPTAVARGGAITTAATSGSYDAGSKISGYMVIFDNASATSAEYYAYTQLENLTVPASGNLQFSRDFATMTSGWKSLSSTPTPPGPTPDVPEPTSGLLLVLGGAALALRRRR